MQNNGLHCNDQLFCLEIILPIPSGVGCDHAALGYLWIEL